MHILFEDNHVLAVVKPVGLPTMGAAEDEPSLVTLAKAYLKQKYQKPGNVYLGVVSRVDAAVSGVVVLARTSKAAARLSEQFRERDVEKIYWALVEGRLEPPQGTLTDWLAKDERQQRMQVVGADIPVHYKQRSPIAGCLILACGRLSKCNWKPVASTRFACS